MSNKKSEPYINPSLYYYLKNIKEQVKDCKDWDNYKMYTNPYEFICNIVPGYKKSICKYILHDINYYIYLEIFYQFNLINVNQSTMHISYDPMISIDSYLTLNNNENIHHLFDLNHLDITNPSHILLNSCKYDLIICDTPQFEVEETIKMLFIQVLSSLYIQRKHGSLIIKIYDLFHYTTLEIVYLLTICYNNVSIYKPNCSDATTSNKYIICKDFIYDDINPLHSEYIHIYDTFQQGISIESILKFKLGYIFINKISEINAIFGQYQIETIKSTLNISLSENIIKLDSLKTMHIKKCVEWCQKHNIHYNKEFNKLSLDKNY